MSEFLFIKTFPEQNTQLWLFFDRQILLTFDKKFKPMLANTLTRTYQEAEKILHDNYKKLMQNEGWDFISIIEDPDYGYYSEVGVNDFDKEVEKIENHSYPYEIRNYRKDGRSVSFFIPAEFLYGELLHDLRVTIHKENLTKYYQDRAEKLNKGCSGDASNCDVLEKRKMGHLLANVENDGEGSIGCFLEDKLGNKYALTAYHVIRGTRNGDFSDIGDEIHSPPVNGKLLGKLSWYQYDKYADIALIKLDDDVEIEKGSVCCFQLKEYIGSAVLPGSFVKICSSVDNIQTRCGIVISTCCVVRKNDNHRECIFGLIQTTNLGQPGDSGSVVANMQNEAVGLLVRDRGDQCSYFMPLDILQKTISLRLDDTQFEFKKFY